MRYRYIGTRLIIEDLLDQYGLFSTEGWSLMSLKERHKRELSMYVSLL